MRHFALDRSCGSDMILRELFQFERRRRMSGLIIAIVVIVLIVVLAAILIGMYNGLVRGRLRVKEAWSGIDVQLKRRSSLIPNLVETVKGYAAHERETLENVTRARAQL